MKSSIKQLTNTPAHSLENEYKTDRATILLEHDNVEAATPKLAELAAIYRQLAAKQQ